MAKTTGQSERSGLGGGGRRTRNGRGGERAGSGNTDVGGGRRLLGSRRLAVAAGDTLAGRTAKVSALNCDVLAGLGEPKILALDGAAAVADISDEHGRAGTLGDATARVGLVGLDVDNSAIHVHFAVTNLVEPRPGKDSLAAGGVSGDGEVIGGRARAGGAVTEEGVHHGPGIAFVVGQRGLAAATAVPGAAVDGEALLGAGGPIGYGLTLVGADEVDGAAAGEVAAIGA